MEKMVGEVKMQIEEENEEKTLEDQVEKEMGNVVGFVAPHLEQFLV